MGIVGKLRSVYLELVGKQLDVLVAGLLVWRTNCDPLKRGMIIDFSTSWNG